MVVYFALMVDRLHIVSDGRPSRQPWRDGRFEIAVDGLLARQQVLGFISYNHSSLRRHETDDETDFSLFASGLIPGYPDTVGVPQRRLAVVPGELFFREYVLAIRHQVGRVAMGLVEGIHDQ